MIGIPVSLIVIFTSIWVLFDAQAIGVRKGLIRGLSDMGKWGWFFSCLGLWIIAFPYYLSKRQHLKAATAAIASRGQMPAASESRNFCPNCGRRISPRFCTGCGQQV
jgi:hypothetical protein